MNILNEEVRCIREQIAFKRQLIRCAEGKERRMQLLQEVTLLEKELAERLEKLQ